MPRPGSLPLACSLWLACASILAAAAAAPAPPQTSSPAPRPRGAASGPPRPDDTPQAEALREEQARLGELLKALAKHSEKYRKGLLRFVCEETLIRSEFDGSTGRRQKEAVDRYDYLLSRSRDGRVRERRRAAGASGTGGAMSLDLQQPEPYLWTLLFTPHYQQLFNFRLAGQEVVHFRLATVIEFDAILPFVDGSEITQWSGRAYIDAESLDLLRVEAEPSGQQIRLEADVRAYHQAPRLGNVPLRRRPRAHLHEVDFGYEREDLRLPSLAITRRFVVTDGQVRALKSQVLQIFADYRLFKVETDEQLKEIRGPEGP